MEVLCLIPAQLPLLRTQFTGKGAIRSSSAAVRRSSRRLKPLIYAAASKPSNASSPRASDDNELQRYPPDVVPYEHGDYVPNNDLGKGITLDPVEYLRNILLSDVYDVAVESPFVQATLLSESSESGVKYWLKRDDRQSVFSFKLRGAYNMMSKLTEEQLATGVITASAGNHAQGVALSAQRLNCRATIVMPTTTPEIKQDAVRRLGGDIDLHGDSFDESQQYALQRAADEGLVFIPPFDHQDIIIGQGTVGMEIVRQMREPIEAIFVPIGGGGLISGIAAYVRAVLPDVKIIGVEPLGANGMALSFHFGQRVGLTEVDHFADGVAVAVVGEETYNVCKQLVDGVVLVDDDHIAAAIKDVFNESRSILEPSGALALAGAKAYCYRNQIQDSNVIAVSSGANMDFDTLKDVVDMAARGSNEEAMLATYLPEEPGSFKRFCELVGPALNISEIKYRYNSDKEKALVHYSVRYPAPAEVDAMVQRMESSQLQTINLSNEYLVKKHLRYLVGGRSNVENELLCRFALPEKSGALLKLLDALSPRWNISLVHYRIKGSTVAYVLIGIQVASSEINGFQDHVKSLGYYCKVLPKNESIQLLMG